MSVDGSWFDLLPPDLVKALERIVSAPDPAAQAEREASADPERAKLYRGVAEQTPRYDP